MGDLRSEILAVGASFKDRIDPAIIDDALEYIDFNEYESAVEVLCERLVEYNVGLTQEEFNRLVRFIRKQNVNPKLIGQLEKLVCDK